MNEEIVTIKPDLTQEISPPEGQKSPPIPKKSKSFKAMLIGVILLIILAAVGYFLISFLNQAKKQEIAEGKRVYHVGILSGLDLFLPIAESFKKEMGSLGYVEGKNIVYDLRKSTTESYAETLKQQPEILKKFVADKVDLIFGYNTEVALEAKEATKGTGIPVVFANTFIEGSNIIKSIGQPGGNITGVRYPGTDVAVKRLEILHELVPQAKRIWLPYQKGYPAVPAELEVIRPAAASLNLTLIEFPSENLANLQAELERRSKLSDIGFDAVLLIPESLSTTPAAFEIIANFTRSQKIPIGGSRIVTEDYGTLFAVTVDNVEIGKSAASIAAKILKGIPAGTIPVLSPEQHLVINYKVAQKLGLTVPESLLTQAKEIIR
jgi:putative tryptophan/tyrosine transport system substrate-binding protein